jgi:hypothetical protein
MLMRSSTLISGIWSQGVPLPLGLTRMTPDDTFEIAPGPAGFERRTGELPMNNAVVRFPDRK